MTPDVQRIAIAEACGFTNITRSGPYKQLCGNIGIVPDYLSDLNAMHEAEKVLTIEQQTHYARKLIEIKDRDEGNGEIEPTDVLSPIEVVAWILQATAAQRAEAFLRTLNLWKDDENGKS